MNEVIAALRRFRDERNWGKFHTPKDLAVSISIETGELLEHFQWRPDSHDTSDLDIAGIAEEAADVLLYTIMLFDRLDLNPIDEALKKIESNKKRYPCDEKYETVDSLLAKKI